MFIDELLGAELSFVFWVMVETGLAIALYKAIIGVGESLQDL